jgi:P27 family predicted phage terminase small subunit
MTPNDALSPSPPAHLSRRSRAFWRRVVADLELEPGHFELLRRLCEAMDRCDEAIAVLEEDGLTVEDRFGQIRPHPAVVIEIQNREHVLRLLQALKLGEGDPQSSIQPARDLARARWEKRWRGAS